MRYHTTGKTHIVLTNKTKAMKDNLSSGNISRAILQNPVMIPLATIKAQIPKAQQPRTLRGASLFCKPPDTAMSE
jgi:hypothetical protein